MVSRILGNRSPFDPYVLNHSEAQLDFILEMFAKDNPGEFKFVRAGQVVPLDQQHANAAWESRLIGAARDRFLNKFVPSKAVLAAAARLSQAGGFLSKGANMRQGSRQPPPVPPSPGT